MSNAGPCLSRGAPTGDGHRGLLRAGLFRVHATGPASRRPRGRDPLGLAVFCPWRWWGRAAIALGGGLFCVDEVLRHHQLRGAGAAVPAAVAILWDWMPARWHDRPSRFWVRIAVAYICGVLSLSALLTPSLPYRFAVAALFGVPAALAAGWGWIPDVGRWLVALRFARLWLPVIVWIGTGIATSNQVQNRDFYAAAAQIIPVLLLALALEARYVRLEGRMGVFQALQAVLLVCLPGYGEWEALRGVAGLPQYEGGDVAATIAAGFTAVAVVAFLGPGDRLVEQLSSKQPSPDSADKSASEVAG